jgi:putative protease
VQEGQGLYARGYEDHQLRPVVNQDYDQAVDGNHVILSTYGDLAGRHHACIAGMTMNIANSYAMAYIYSLAGINGIIVSSEMSDDNIKASLDAFEDRYGFTPYLYKFTYGKRTLMYIKDRFLVNDTAAHITDIQNNTYDIKDVDGTAELLESVPEEYENPYCYGRYMIISDPSEYQRLKGE